MGFKCPPLTSRNYATWKDLAWSRLMEKGYSLYVDGTITKPIDAKEALEWKKIDLQDLGAILRSVHHDLLFHIINCKESKEAWDKLKTIYGTVDEEKGFQIEDDLLLLDPNSFDII